MIRPFLRLSSLSLLALLLCGATRTAAASATVLLEEPFGSFGTMTQVGHSAVYLDRICAETPRKLRMCRPGEFGVVLSRYHRIQDSDWVAIPLVAYLYAVSDVRDVPATIDRAGELHLRDAYRRAFLQSFAPDGPDGRTPSGDWIQTIGGAYDRKIYGFRIATSVEQDRALVDFLNSRPNRPRYNLAARNCANFSGMIVNFYYPHTVHPNWIPDLFMITPKQVARSVVRLGKRNPEADLDVFLIPQVPGSLRRSHTAKGVAEGLLKTKRYLLPILYFQPEVVGGLVLAYEVGGRFSIPPHSELLTPENLAMLSAPAPLAADRGAAPLPGPDAELPVDSADMNLLTDQRSATDPFRFTPEH